MSKKLLSTLIASLFAAAPAFAQSDDDPMRVAGQGDRSAASTTTRTRKDKAKLEEYQDLGNGVLSNVGVHGRNSTTLVRRLRRELRPQRPVHVPARRHVRRLQGRGVPQRDAAQFLVQRRHAVRRRGQQPADGDVPAARTRATWNSFNLGYERKDAGGYFEWQKNSPWYFRVDGNQVKFNGTKVGSGANGTSPGNGYTSTSRSRCRTKTSNWGVEGGYQTSKATLSLRWDYSKFDNSNETLRLDQPVLRRQPARHDVPARRTTRSTSSRRPATTATCRGSSVISARYTWAKTTSNVGLAPDALNSPAASTTTDAAGPGQLQRRERQPVVRARRGRRIPVDERRHARLLLLDEAREQVGRHSVRQRADAAARRRPRLRQLRRGRIASRHGMAYGNCENDLFNYTKNNVGFDVWWRFARGQRLGFGYDYSNLDQTRVDYDKSHCEQALGRVQEHDARHADAAGSSTST